MTVRRGFISQLLQESESIIIGDDIFTFKCNYDKREWIYSVKVTKEVDIKDKTWWYLYHTLSDYFEQRKLAPVSMAINIIKNFSSNYISDKGKVKVLNIFNVFFGKSKVVRKDGWWNFCKKIEEHEESILVGSAYFTKVSGKSAYPSYMPRINLKINIEPDVEYLQGFSNVESVNVEEKYRNMGLAKKMYQVAEQEFGMKIIPSFPLSDGGKALHKSLGNL